MTEARKRLALGAIFLTILVAIFMLDLHRFLSWTALAQLSGDLEQAVSTAYGLSVVAYILAYIAVVALSLPGAIWMTLAGGFMFGPIWGGLFAVLGASGGACLLFLIARYVVGDSLRHRYGPRLQSFEAGFQRDAISYLFVLRFVPLFPFFLVNLGAALAGVAFWQFAVTTFFGIMPGGFVYAGLGSGLRTAFAGGTAPDLSLFSRPEIFLSLIGLGVLSLIPVIMRKRRR